MLNRNWQRPPPIILKYYLYQATSTYGFFWPVFTIFLLARGLSYTQIGLLGSISAAIVIAGEIPTGYIGDRIGRRNSLLVGSVLLAVSLSGFVVAQTFASFAVLWILWGLGQAFRSGSGDAWLYDTLKQQLREDQYTRIRGRGESVNLWVSAATMLVAGVLYGIDPSLPFLAGGVLLGSSLFILHSMPETEQGTADDDAAFAVFEALPVIRERLMEPPLRSFVVYIALFFAIISAGDEFIQPIAVQTLQFSNGDLGPLYAGFTAVAAIVSYYTGDIEALLSTRWVVLLIPVLTSVLFIIPLIVPLSAVPLFFLMKSARAVMNPIASGYINDHTGSVGRATVLSATSMVYALVGLPLKPLSGFIADLTSPIVAVGALGTLFLCGGVVIHGRH